MQTYKSIGRNTSVLLIMTTLLMLSYSHHNSRDTYHNRHIRSDEGLTPETLAFQILHGGNSTFINSFDKTKFLFTYHNHRHYNSHKKMVDHFRLVMMMSVISVSVIMLFGMPATFLWLRICFLSLMGSKPTKHWKRTSHYVVGKSNPTKLLLEPYYLKCPSFVVLPPVSLYTSPSPRDA